MCLEKTVAMNKNSVHPKSDSACKGAQGPSVLSASSKALASVLTTLKSYSDGFIHHFKL